MGYVTVDQVSKSKLQSSYGGGSGAGLGANFFSKIFGGGDNISQYEKQGDSLQQIFANWKPDFARYSNILGRIPTGSQKGRLNTQMSQIASQERQLAVSLGTGATPGTETRDLLNSYVGNVKSFGKAVGALATQYGISPEAQAATSSAKGGSILTQSMVGGIPNWLLALGAIGAIMFAKKSKR